VTGWKSSCGDCALASPSRPGRTVVHEARRGHPQQVRNGGLRALADAGCLHGCTEVAEPPGGLAGRDEPVQMAALHADIPDAAHLTSEDRLEKLLQTPTSTGGPDPRVVKARYLAG
jgi:hypothetical protein